jgi:CHAT domain-containing protein
LWLTMPDHARVELSAARARLDLGPVLSRTPSRPRTKHEPIGYAQPEAAWARQWFPRHQTLSDPDANHDTVIQALPSAHVHHFICHGSTRPGAPLDSALLLAGDSELTSQEILANHQPGEDRGPDRRRVPA